MLMAWNLGIVFYVFYLVYRNGKANIINIEELQVGVCNGDTLKLQCNFSCSFTKLHWSKDSGNEMGPCFSSTNTIHCVEEARYYVTHQLIYTTNVTVRYKDDLTTWSCHATCVDNSIEEYNISVKPCIRGFQVSSQYSPILKTLDINVTHQDFNLGNGIQLLHSVSSNELTHCFWNGTSTVCIPPPSGYSVSGLLSGFIFTIHDVEPSSIFSYNLLMDGMTKTIFVTSSISSARKLKGSEKNDSKMEPGAIAGIVIGSVVGAALIVAVIKLFIHCKKKRDNRV